MLVYYISNDIDSYTETNMRSYYYDTYEMRKAVTTMANIYYTTIRQLYHFYIRDTLINLYIYQSLEFSIYFEVCVFLKLRIVKTTWV